MEKIIDNNDYILIGCTSFETSKVLKNIYNKLCHYAWHTSERIKPEYEDEYGDYYPHEISDEFPDKYNEIVETVWGLHSFTTNNLEDYNNLYCAPLIYDVIQYFVKEHRVFISPFWDNRFDKWGYYYELMDYPDLSGQFISDEYFDDMVEATDKGIREVAKKLLNKTLFY